MSLALLVFIFFAKEETIEYYVKNNQKEQAIKLLEWVIPKKKPENEVEHKEYNEFYERKFIEKKEYGVLYTGEIPSKEEQKRQAKKLAK